MLNRRSFLRQLALVATLPFAWQPADGFAAALERKDAPATPGYLPPLSSGELKFVDALAEGILPATDTPGARAAGVPAFIGLLFSEWMYRDEQQAFRDGLAALTVDAKARTGRAFVELDPARQLELLQAWDTAAFAPAPREAPPPFFRRFKTLVVVGYYTSEVGQVQELQVQFGAGEMEDHGPAPSPPPFRL